MVEPSNADLQSCPETVQNYVKHLEAEASEKYCVCPIMSRVTVGGTKDDRPDFSDLVEIKCKGKDCALWVIEMRDGNHKTERCGLIK
jgi:hypothetical protein